MRLIKVTGGLGNQMFIYAFYLRMKKYYPKVRIDLSDMMHYKVHYGYEMHRVFNLPHNRILYKPTSEKKLSNSFSSKKYMNGNKLPIVYELLKRNTFGLYFILKDFISRNVSLQILRMKLGSLSLLTSIKPTVEVLICLKFWTRMKTQYLYIFVVEIICNPSIGLLPEVYASYLTIKTQ